MNNEEIKLKCLELGLKHAMFNANEQDKTITVDEVILIADEYYKSLI